VGKLDGKVALITGAGSGMGRATALLFAREGARVVVADYVPAGGKETVGMIKEAGGEAIFVEVNVSKAADVERMVKETLDIYGRIDILYNNAGVSGRYAFTADTTEEEWDLILNINLKGVFLGSKYTIPVMLEQGGGVIITTASTAALSGSPSLPAYSASKAGVVQLTKTMAMEYGKGNIRVNCICPGAIHTPMLEASPIPLTAGRAFPLGRIGEPEDIAQAALYLASDDSSFITGQILVVDGGFTAGIMPPIKSK